MPRYAAFLRGINVGGRKATTGQLCAAFEEMGFAAPATFRASGNVVFEATGAADKLAARVERGLEQALGFPVAVFVRTAAEVRAIARHQPFDAKTIEAGRGKLQVALLADKPSAAARKRVMAFDSAADRLAVKGRELYWLPAGGLMQSDMGMDGIGAALGPNTVRTKGTIEQLAAKFF